MNRDSLTYKEQYGLGNTQTLIRGTLRNTGFCQAWDVFVTIGLTDDSFIIDDCNQLTYAALVRSLLPKRYKNLALKDAIAKLCALPPDGDIIKMIEWTGILADNRITTESGSPAKILQDLLEPKWLLKETDKDMIVMVHDFEYELNDKTHRLQSSLTVTGEDAVQTAMAKTVGLPVAIAAKLFLQGKIDVKGVVIPVMEEIYQPVLEELKLHGITFQENEEH
jgi:saccharopine dehydrogenase-like protein